jgi:hypothetical protein
MFNKASTSKRFFFEKKNQKTFVGLARGLSKPHGKLTKFFCCFLLTKRSRSCRIELSKPHG